MLVDPVMLLGVCVGANAILAGERKTNFTTWAQAAWKDAVGIIGKSGWRGSLLHLLGVQLEKNNSAADTEAKLSPAWLRAALNPRDWATVEDGEAAEVLRTAISGADAVPDGFEAVIRLAAIDWAVARALDFNLDAMTITDVARVLNNVTSVFQRWTWEEKPRTTKRGALARQWHIDNEYHVQSLLYAILKPVFPALEEEKYVASTGTYQPRADLSLLALQLVIEIKFWYRGDKARNLIEQIAADLSLYLRSDSPYRHVIAVIWDDGARTEEHDELKRGLTGLNGMHEVVILNRPSLMGV